MSHQCLYDAFAPAEAIFAHRVRVATWGHLAPRKNKSYRGHIVFGVGCFGSDGLNPTALECEFGELESSPWFYDAVTELMQPFTTEVGCVYRWEGAFRNYEFKGRLRKMALTAEAVI
jgi:hypothetical protein